LQRGFAEDFGEREAVADEAALNKLEKGNK